MSAAATLKTIPLVRELPPDLQLARGSHASPEAGMCVMEAVVFLIGEKWSDAPACVSPIIRRFAIGLNDRWSDADRQLLLPYIRKVIGTSRSPKDEATRRFLALDWCYRTALPAALRFARMDELAERLAVIAPIVDQATWSAAWPSVNAAYNETRGRRLAWREDLRKQIRAEAAVAAAAAAVEVAAEAVEVAVVAISRTLAGRASEGSPWPAPIIGIVRTGLASLPKNPSYDKISNAIYGPTRDKMRELLRAGTAGAEYEAYRRAMQRDALTLLDRMIDVGRVAEVAA